MLHGYAVLAVTAAIALPRTAAGDEELPAVDAGPTGAAPLAPAPAPAPASTPAPALTPAPAPASAPAPAAASAPSAPIRPSTEPPLTELPRETPVETPLGAAPALTGSAFGGYGELTLNAPTNGPAVVDLRRFVLFFGHNFNEHIRFYSEFEVEHAVTSSTDRGEAEIEQAYLDGLLDSRINLRGGLVLMPVGIINIYHEPPSFNGVDRPDVDTFVVPTTWREPGFGIFGALTESLRYQLYFVDGFNANGFSAASALAEGHQEAQLADAGDFGAVARLDYEPVLGTVLGLSGYYATSGNSLTHSVGKVPVGIAEADARTRLGGLTARAEAALVSIGDAARLDRAFADGTDEQKTAGPVSSLSWGAYAEVGCNVFYPWSNIEQNLTAFARFDVADTQASVPAGFQEQPQYRRLTGTFGLVWKPIPQIGIKADYRRHHLGSGEDFDELAAAITWLF